MNQIKVDDDLKELLKVVLQYLDATDALLAHLPTKGYQVADLRRVLQALVMLIKLLMS